MKLKELAKITNAVVENGSDDLEVNGAAGLDIAFPDQITFLANPKYT